MSKLTKLKWSIKKAPSLAKLKAALKKLDEGLLYSGCHAPYHGKFCLLEFRGVLTGVSTVCKPKVYNKLETREADKLVLTDSFIKVDFPELRGLNDSYPSNLKGNKARTKALLPVLQALWTYNHWTKVRAKRFSLRLQGGLRAAFPHAVLDPEGRLSDLVEDTLRVAGSNIPKLNKIAAIIVKAAKESVSR